MDHAILGAVANEHRRGVLLDLLESNTEPDTLRVHVDPHRAPEANKRERIALYHNHLPRLEDAGFIDWDQATGEVTKGPAFEDLKPLLRFLRDNQDEFPTSRNAMGLGRERSD